MYFYVSSMLMLDRALMSVCWVCLLCSMLSMVLNLSLLFLMLVTMSCVILSSASFG